MAENLASCTASSATQCRSNPVSGRSLPKILRKSEADDLLHAFLGREDVPDDFRDYVRGWIKGEFSMFRPSVRTEYVNHRQAFSGLKEAS
jgi:hypothetical protein